MDQFFLKQIDFRGKGVYNNRIKFAKRGNFMKIFKKVIAMIACVACLFGASCGESENPFAVTEFDGKVDLVHQEVLNYLNSDGSIPVTHYLPNGVYRHDQGKAVTLGYDTDLDVKSADIQISRTQDFAVIEVEDTINVRRKKVEITNLYPGVNYYFRINLTLADGSVLTSKGSFETNKGARFIELSGASNVRDLGGWKTENGKQIKYGLIYRGGEIDGGKNTGHPDFCLTPYGVEQARSFGIKTEIDLRSENDKASEHSILGEDIQRTFYNSAQYQNILKPENAERTRKIFSDLAKPSAYPVYLHCTHGVDRAGSITLLLEGLLGVSKQDLIKDYELSAFYHNYKHVHRELDNGGTILGLIDGIDAFEGETFAKKVENFLLSIGVTAQEISSIRATLLE